MSNEYLLINRSVRILTDGGWDLRGVVIDDLAERLIIQTADEDNALIFKSKISAIIIVTDVDLAQVAIDSSQKNIGYVVARGRPDTGGNVADNTANDDLSDGGVSLPYEVLMEGLGARPDIFKNRDSDDDDYSVSMASLFGDSKSRISVTADDPE